MKLPGLLLILALSSCAHEPVELVPPETACQLPLAASLYLQNYYCGGR